MTHNHDKNVRSKGSGDIVTYFKSVPVRVTVFITGTLLVALILNLALSILTLEKIYSKSLLSEYSVIGRYYVRKIELSLGFGKTLPKYTGMEKLLKSIKQDYPEIADILNKVFASLDQKTLQNLNSRTGFVGGEIAYLVARDYLIEQGFLTNDPSGFPIDLPTPTIDLPDPTQQSLEIVNHIIRVKTDPLWDKTFEVNLETMRDVRVVGWFMASGGGFNDIKVLILDDIDFINWENRHEVEGLYKTDKITIAKVDVPITVSGKYHLVFDNRFSTFSHKNVLAKFYLYWSED